MDYQPQDGVQDIDISGTLRPLFYPNTGNTGMHIKNILAGVDYPVIPLDGFTPRVIVDVGANVGACALYFLSRYPRSRLLCFEPAPLNLVYLRHNTAFTPQIEVFPYGLYSKSSKAPLDEGKSQCMQHSIFPGPEVTDKFVLIDIRSAFEELRGVSETPWLLKIDVEGAELGVLESIKPLFDRVGVIYLEYHSEQERLGFDATLSNDFMLWRSSARIPHRGNVAYVAKTLVTGTDRFSMWAIAPRGLE
jgi:FkbM family methyltransferase